MKAVDSIEKEMNIDFDKEIGYGNNYSDYEVSYQLFKAKEKLEKLKKDPRKYSKDIQTRTIYSNEINSLKRDINFYNDVLSGKYNSTQGKADLNYIKENHLTDGSVLNSGSAFSLGIDGMALDQSLLNYGIDAGKLIGKAA